MLAGSFLVSVSTFAVSVYGFAVSVVGFSVSAGTFDVSAVSFIENRRFTAVLSGFASKIRSPRVSKGGKTD